MPRIIEYTENEGSAQTSASTLLNLINQSKSATNAMAGFQVKSLVVSSVSAVVFGSSFSMLFASILGPGLPFLAGAGFGFVGGCVHRWRTDVKEAKDAFYEFPELMEHHLRLTDPPGLPGKTFAEWKMGIATDAVKQGYAVAALYSAAPAIQRIKEMKEEALIEKTLAKWQSAEEQGE